MNENVNYIVIISMVSGSVCSEQKMLLLLLLGMRAVDPFLTKQNTKILKRLQRSIERN